MITSIDTKTLHKFHIIYYSLRLKIVHTILLKAFMIMRIQRVFSIFHIQLFLCKVFKCLQNLYKHMSLHVFNFLFNHLSRVLVSLSIK